MPNVSSMILPATLTIGRSCVALTSDPVAALAFLNGFQAGHLTYMVYGKRARLYDTDLVMLIVARKNARHVSLWFNTGFLVGYLTTLTQKGVYFPTNQSFCEGYQEGKHASLRLRDYPLTTDELCRLLSWQPQGHTSAFNGGYIVGFLHALAEHGKGGR